MTLKKCPVCDGGGWTNGFDPRTGKYALVPCPLCVGTHMDASIARRANAATPAREAKKPRPAPSCPLESEEQEMFFDEVRKRAAKAIAKLNPWAVTFAIPNGGGRSKREAAALVRQGVKAGVSDIYMSWAVSVTRPDGVFRWHGLFLEMKRSDPKASRTSAAQADWIENVNLLGYIGRVVYGHQEALRVADAYLAGTLKEQGGTE